MRQIASAGVTGSQDSAPSPRGPFLDLFARPPLEPDGWGRPVADLAGGEQAEMIDNISHLSPSDVDLLITKFRVALGHQLETGKLNQEEYARGMLLMNRWEERQRYGTAKKEPKKGNQIGRPENFKKV